jgi:hypothetical protein
VDDTDEVRAGYYWRKAFEQLAETVNLSAPDALDLIGFPREYVAKMGLDGQTIDEVDDAVEALEARGDSGGGNGTED